MARLPGETSLIVWQQNGARLVYDLTVRMSNARLEAARQQIARDFPTEDINVTFENDTAFVRGTVKDLTAADRVMVIASTLGKTVNLLRVEFPPVEPQVVLKVRFANVDRAASIDAGRRISSAARSIRAPRSAPARLLSPDGRQVHRSVRLSIFSCSGPISTWRRRSRRCRASACSKCWRNRTCWRSAASRPASWPAASSRFPWCSRGRRRPPSASCGGNMAFGSISAERDAARHHPPEGGSRK